MIKIQYYFRCKKCIEKVTELIPRDDCVTFMVGMRFAKCPHIEFDRIMEE